jgi:hypothetical protein
MIAWFLSFLMILHLLYQIEREDGYELCAGNYFGRGLCSWMHKEFSSVNSQPISWLRLATDVLILC